MAWEIREGSALDLLRAMADGSVHCCVTSPPYWGLRDYGTAEWEGGDAECDHVERNARNDGDREGVDGFGGNRNKDGHADMGALRYREVCGKCGARRIDQQLGLEPTPEQYVANMVEVFREVRRVLRDDGTLWLNLGDSYATGAGKVGDHPSGGSQGERWQGATTSPNRMPIPGLKPKDLVGIPWRVAFALQADGWYLRSDIIWSKPNPMPESVTDRPTKAHEYVFLLTKSARYFYDGDAVAQPQSREWAGETVGPRYMTAEQGRNDGGKLVGRGNGITRNRRSVWTITTKPYAEAHFATFPPELPEVCIKAGTSEKGCCAECGAPWDRVVVATAPDGRRAVVKRGKAYDDDGNPLMGDDNMIDHGVRGSWNSGGQTLKRETTGWRSTCDCEPYEDDIDNLNPCTVLDPFSGAGTAGLVATRLGRSYVGIELNPEYAEMSRRRIMAGAKTLPADGWHPTHDDLPLFR